MVITESKSNWKNRKKSKESFKHDGSIIINKIYTLDDVNSEPKPTKKNKSSKAKPSNKKQKKEENSDEDYEEESESESKDSLQNVKQKKVKGTVFNF